VSTKENEFLKKLGGKIRAARHEKKMSLNQLSAQFGLEKSSISKLENGKSNSTVLTLWGLSEALNVPIENFFKGVA
jgi:transcriptional regulator with XRE-family HTH domain